MRSSPRFFAAATVALLCLFHSGLSAAQQRAVSISKPSRDGYEIDTLANGKRVYSDRNYVFTDVTNNTGNTFIRTSADERLAEGGNGFLTFEVKEPVIVIVALDPFLADTARPAWLADYTDLKDSFGRGIEQRNFNNQLVRSRGFGKRFGPGTVTLGANNGKAGSIMYFVVVIPDTQPGTQALFDVSRPQTAPFPSDRFTITDTRNFTRLRVNLPKPDCSTRASDCSDIDVINTLDGFNLQPRISIPFSGAINPVTVNSSSVFLVNLGDLQPSGQNAGTMVGINQAIWDPVSNTLFAEPDQLLDQHSTYALIATNSIRDAAGQPVQGRAFAEFLQSTPAGDLVPYRDALRRAVTAARRPASSIIAASVFTTQSITHPLERIRDGIKAQANPVADFNLASDGSRTFYPIASLGTIGVARQAGVAPVFSNSEFPIGLLTVLPNAVSSIAFGRFSSAQFRTRDFVIPATGTAAPAVQANETIYFNLYLPSGPRPPNGWPVAIYGHGFTDNKEGGSAFVAASMAARGIATIAINVPGHGGGPQGRLTINRPSRPAVTLPLGGRAVDQNGDGQFGLTEGLDATGPRGILNNRDGLRQTVADVMQLTRIIETRGIDANGDGTFDLNPDRIYYFGQSLGAIYGTILLAVEPSIQVGVPNVGGGPIIDIARLGLFRGSLAGALTSRVPSLGNAAADAPFLGFNENIPIRGRPTITNNVPGAIAIQNFFDNAEWVTQSGDPVAYARHLRKAPLAGVSPKSIIFQFARGDQIVPNPTSSNIIRAGDLTDRTTLFRTDIAIAANAAQPKNPHVLLTNAILNQPVALFSFAAQNQIAVFFQSDGQSIIDPDTADPFFEVPIMGPLPDEVNFIP